MSGVGRMTWRRLAVVFAAGLRDKTCTDHVPPRDDCPYCRDSAAMEVYEAKVAGRSTAPWRDVVTALAVRFQHFEECPGHSVEAADAAACPFCRDEHWWRRYVEFCRRQGAAAVRRDVDVVAERSVTVPLDVFRLEGDASTTVSAKFVGDTEW